jgi:hypothetical protein
MSKSDSKERPGLLIAENCLDLSFVQVTCEP